MTIPVWIVPLSAAAVVFALAVLSRDRALRAACALLGVGLFLFGVGGMQPAGSVLALALSLAAIGCSFAAAVPLAFRALRSTTPHLSQDGASPESDRIESRRQAVEEMQRLFEIATRNSQITVFYQDRDLVYRWIVNPQMILEPDAAIGKSDTDLHPEGEASKILVYKRRALATNSTQSFEMEGGSENQRQWLRVDVVPIMDEHDQAPAGIVCTAIDITRSKRLDTMRTDLSRRLAETLQRFNLALRSERLVVYAQDETLRYTWANTDDTPAGSLIGRTDEDILPPEDSAPIVSFKRDVMATGRAGNIEVGVGAGAARRWYDLYLEPNLTPDGKVSGVTGASIDITHRKRAEERMRLVMRELTHRTKNLLAVVIAIARQTAQQADTVDSYVPSLIARLKALSSAQDLIVADDWEGVEIEDLVNVLVGQYMPTQSRRVTISGPKVTLSPEAAQNLGLAIHEMADNAMQYGAFANQSGTLSVRWSHCPLSEDKRLVLQWEECGGPHVNEPQIHGFGMAVIERNLARALGADVDLQFHPTGLCVEIALPMDAVAPPTTSDRAAGQRAAG